jgi:hypothetical protein
MSGIAAPTDGLFFRIAAGELRCVLNNAGVETQSEALPIPTANERHKYTISCCQDFIEFWIDDVLYAKLETPVTQDSPTATNYLPMNFRIYNSGSPGVAVKMLIAECFISVGDAQTVRCWPTQMVCSGGGAYQAQQGQTQAQTANYANTAAPVSATLSNTAAGYATLGGQFQFLAVAGAETDYCLFAYTVPAVAITTAAKNLVITGIRIDTINTGAAVATTATVLQWGIAVGSTAVTLATAEGAGTKVARRSTLGFQTFPVGAAIGSQAVPIDIQFAAPMTVEAGNVLHVLLKMPIGTATGSQIIRGTVFINGYFE